MADLIDRQAAIDLWERYRPYIATKASEYDTELKKLPSAQPEQPSREYVEQLRWERDLAIQQLKDLGYGLGEKPRTQPEIVRCKDCKYGSPNGEYGCRVYHFKLYEKHEMNADDFCSRAERREE